MGKGDKIKESKPVFLPFSLVPTLFFQFFFLSFYTLWLLKSLSFTPIHIFKNLSIVHNFLPCSLALSITVSGAQFVASMNFQCHPSLPINAAFTSKCMKRKDSERSGSAFSPFRTKYACIDQFSMDFGQFRPELAKNRRTKEEKKK